MNKPWSVCQRERFKPPAYGHPQCHNDNIEVKDSGSKPLAHDKSPPCRFIPVHSYRYFNFWYLVDTTSTVYCHYSYDGLENKPARGTKMQKHIAELEVDRSADSKTTQGLTAYAGNQSCPVKFSRPMLPGKSGLAKVSRRVAACLKIPAGSYRIYHFDRHSLYLGPVVGIFSSAIKPGGCPGRSEPVITKK